MCLEIFEYTHGIDDLDFKEAPKFMKLLFGKFFKENQIDFSQLYNIKKMDENLSFR